MKLSPIGWLVVLVFAAIFGIALLGKGGLTGQASTAALPVTSGTVLSVIAAVVAIGVLVVAGLQQNKK